MIMVIVLAIARSAAATRYDPYFAATQGDSLGACTISTDSKCVSSPNYPSTYPHSTSCTFSRVNSGYLSACAFSTEKNYDTLNVRRRGSTYSGSASSSSVPGTSVYRFLDPGTPVYQTGRITWSSDGTEASTGWKICAYATHSTASSMSYCNSDLTNPPTPPSSNMTLIQGACTLQGDCVSSPNYPSSYSSDETCNISVNNGGYLTSTTFSTESYYDQVSIRRRGGSYSGTSAGAPTISNVYVPRSSTIDWSTDQSASSTGWQICYSSTYGASVSVSDVQVVASLSFYDSYLSVSTQSALKSDFQTIIQNWYSSLALSFTVTGEYHAARRSGITYTMTGTSSTSASMTFTQMSTVGLSSSIDTQVRSACSSASSSAVSCSFNRVDSVSSSSGLSGEGCCDVSSSDCTAFSWEHGSREQSCGAFSQKSSCWTSEEETARVTGEYEKSHCVAKSADDCCDVNGGAVAGVVIGCFVGVVGCILLCCFLCPSCPGAKCCKNKHNDDGVIVQQPVRIQSMGTPSAQTAPVFQPQAVPTVAQYPAKPMYQAGLDEPPPYVPADPHSSGANSYEPSYAPTTTQAAGGGVTVRTWNCQSCNHSNVTSGSFCGGCGHRNSVVPV